jgi:hypothetical protein
MFSILTVDRSDKFISEIIIFCLNAFYDKTILERYFKISLGIMKNHTDLSYTLCSLLEKYCI